MRLVLSSAARRDIIHLDLVVSARVEAAIDGLIANPRPSGCLLLHGERSRIWRIRVGDWRILYEIDDATDTVTILRVLHRSRAYS